MKGKNLAFILLVFTNVYTYEQLNPSQDIEHWATDYFEEEKKYVV